MSQSFAYDNIGRLVDSKTRRSAEQRRSRHYSWGSADRLLSIEDDRYGLTQYSYSPSGELTMATYADGRKEYRLSDKVGNLYNDPDKKLRKYLEGGRIERSGEWIFKYDKDGQLIEKFRGKAGIFGTKKDRWEYSWNQNGTLKGVFAPHRRGHWTSFTYDALGRRLTKLGDATFRYLWNGNVPLHEWRTGECYEDGGLKSYSEDLKTWLFEEESFVPLALIQDGKAYGIVCDQLGTPTEAYDEEGKEVWYRRLDMNGKILEEAQPGLNPEGYVSIPFLRLDPSQVTFLFNEIGRRRSLLSSKYCFNQEYVILEQLQASFSSFSNEALLTTVCWGLNLTIGPQFPLNLHFAPVKFDPMKL